MSNPNKMAAKLREKIANGDFMPMPCCFDALSAKMIEQAGFGVTFMSGFAASASRLGQPDLGLMSYAEVVDQARNITDAISIPVIVDGDTGYGNAMNVRRTVEGFAKAGCAGVLIEDQLAPKRCGHTPGKDVVSRDEAFDRIKAAVDARQEGTDILIMGRTDANHTHGLDEAIHRGKQYQEIGADIVFIEAPKTVEEMETICREVPGCHMANIVEGGLTPNLSMEQLQDVGFQFVAYPLTLLAASMQAMKQTLELMRQDLPRANHLMDFEELRDRIGFNEYYETSQVYETSRRS
ncbi:MAG: isocitrate lyase/PEP mutase family protein [Pseudomonadota bacterium]|jgi:2-methylisocitrate lyase-like PEP mutase family enzyme|nr:isocitrate lyase/PEP mutase family protein [Pseudomonadota bacterium]|tara:strand:+ start:1330 stop:2211 length:882 start_codon:yes stop_codon:yes gene_type:complete